MRDSGVSIVIPVYNSERILPQLVERLETVLPSQSSTFELILVNDGSTNHSWEVIQTLAQERDWIYGINLQRNYGQHNALLCGIRAAEHPIIVTMVDDLQHPPEEIPALLQELEKGQDVVYAKEQKKQHSFWRNLSSTILRRTLQIAMATPIAMEVSAFRAFRTRLREVFASYGSPFVSIDVLLSWGATRFSAVEVRHDARRIGHSNYSFRKLFGHAMDIATGFSIRPLRLVSVTGFFFTLFGFAVLMYVVGRYFLKGGSVPGFPFLASLIAIFSGSQLFSIGIIGEYLAPDSSNNYESTGLHR